MDLRGISDMASIRPQKKKKPKLVGRTVYLEAHEWEALQAEADDIDKESATDLADGEEYEAFNRNDLVAHLIRVGLEQLQLERRDKKHRK